jgi:hypothetical protein
MAAETEQEAEEMAEQQPRLRLRHRLNHNHPNLSVRQPELLLLLNRALLIQMRHDKINLQEQSDCALHFWQTGQSVVFRRSPDNHMV